MNPLALTGSPSASHFRQGNVASHGSPGAGRKPGIPAHASGSAGKGSTAESAALQERVLSALATSTRFVARDGGRLKLHRELRQMIEDAGEGTSFFLADLVRAGYGSSREVSGLSRINRAVCLFWLCS